MNDGKCLVIIPAYNEEACLERVVSQFAENPDPRVDYVVVNDGSTDNTLAICRQKGYRCIDLPINLGLSGAVKAGMICADKMGYSYALQFDGDGQHRKEYIPQMMACIDEGYDIIISSRFLEKPKPRSLRMLGNRMISSAIRLTCGVRITDPTSGMRMYNKKLIYEFARSSNYDPEPDTIAFLLQNGAKVKEIQVEMDERQGGVSYLTMFHSMSYMLRTTISIMFLQWFRKRGENNKGKA